MIDGFIPSWANLWAFSQAAGTIALVIIAWVQISALRRERNIQQQFHINWESLRACEKYDSDPVLADALKTLRLARNSGDLRTNVKNYTLEMITVLNFLEGIVIGIEQEFYNEDVVYDHLHPILLDHVGEFLSDPYRNVILEDQRESYDRLIRKAEEWEKRKHKPIIPPTKFKLPLEPEAKTMTRPKK